MPGRQWDPADCVRSTSGHVVCVVLRCLCKQIQGYFRALQEPPAHKQFLTLLTYSYDYPKLHPPQVMEVLKSQVRRVGVIELMAYSDCHCRPPRGPVRVGLSTCAHTDSHLPEEKTTCSVRSLSCCCCYLGKYMRYHWLITDFPYISKPK